MYRLHPSQALVWTAPPATGILVAMKSAHEFVSPMKSSGSQEIPLNQLETKPKFPLILLNATADESPQKSDAGLVVEYAAFEQTPGIVTNPPVL